jgi:hypothetical protein
VWTAISLQFTPSANCNNLIVFIWTQDVPGNAADYFQVSECGLFDGSVAQPWVPPLPADEFDRCQRYCQSIQSTAASLYAPVGIGIAYNTTVAYILRVLPVTMRVTPSLTAIAAEWALHQNLTVIVLASGGLAITGNESTPDSVTFTCTVAAGLTALYPYFLASNNAAGRLLLLTAEL